MRSKYIRARNQNQNKLNIPKFSCETTIINNVGTHSFNDVFEVYTSIIDNNPYLVSPDLHTHNLSILSLNDYKLISNLFGHKSHILSIRYFPNIKNNKEYLISSSEDKSVIIWDITSSDFPDQTKIKLNYDSFSYSNLLLFNINDSDYIITSCNQVGCIRVYSFYDTKNYNELKKTENNFTFYLLSWNYDNKYYIIECCQNKIALNNLLDDKEEEIILNSHDTNISFYFNGFIYKQNYLCTCSDNGFIIIWDLVKKNIFKSICLNECKLFNIMLWDEKYCIVAVSNKNCFKIVDIDDGKECGEIGEKNSLSVNCAKKISVKKYGEVLITSGLDKNVKLWKKDN